MKGAQGAFLLGMVAALVTVLFATSVGAVAAYLGGWIDSFFMRLADLLLMLPALAIFIVMSSVFRFELWHLAILIGVLSGFGGVAIVLKSQALAVKVKPFIEAARVAGGSTFRVITVHVIPNVMPLSFLYMMFTVTAAIQTEAVLSFLGLLNIDMSLGADDRTGQEPGLLPHRHALLVVGVPRRTVRVPPRRRVLPGRAGHGRGGQPEAEEAMTAAGTRTMACPACLGPGGARMLRRNG